MPYIKPEERPGIDAAICELINNIDNPGQLNYTISRLVHEYIGEKGMCYLTINEAVGVLECAKLELYQQIAVPYEANKKELNGSVSDLDEDSLPEMHPTEQFKYSQMGDAFERAFPNEVECKKYIQSWIKALVEHGGSVSDLDSAKES